MGERQKMARSAIVTREDFHRFWAKYPRKVARFDAIKAWAKLDPSPELLETILTALAWQTQQPDWLKDGGRFVPLPATYIRGQRWLDEPRTSDRRQVVPGQVIEDYDWFEECRCLHGRTCNGQYGHWLRMQMDAVKADDA